jgi:hypothetical protein
MPTGGDAVALGRTAPAGEPHAVTAEVVDAARFAALQPAWLDLVARAAEPNAFMDPALLAATAQTGPDDSGAAGMASRRGRRRSAACRGLGVRA